MHAWAPLSAAIITIGICFWSGVALQRQAAVSPLAWSILFACCVVAGPAAWALLQPRSAGWWLRAAGYAVLCAVIFYGANEGLDALKGAHRKKPDVARHLGGLQLWHVLVPGGLSIALGGGAASLVSARRGGRLGRDGRDGATGR